jgi:hypothetical protein
MPAAQRRRFLPSTAPWLNLLKLVFLLLVAVATMRLVWQVSRSRWDRELPLTLVVAGKEKLALLQVDPAGKKALLLQLPDNLLIGVASVGSEYQAKSLWRFGEVEGRAGEIVQTSVAAFTGVWVDGYLYDPEWHEGMPLNWRLLFNKKVQTNLSFYDLMASIRAVSGLRSDQKAIVSLPNNLLEEKTLPDGYKVATLNEQRLALLGRQYFSTPLVLADRRTVGLVNGSSVPGMARLLERMATSAGGAVVEVNEGEKTEGWCHVRYSGQVTGLVKWLKKRLGCKLENTDWQRARAEVEVVLGEDWGKAFNR